MGFPSTKLPNDASRIDTAIPRRFLGEFLSNEKKRVDFANSNALLQQFLGGFELRHLGISQAHHQGFTSAERGKILSSMHTSSFRSRPIQILLISLGVIGAFLQGCASIPTNQVKSGIEISVSPKTASVPAGKSQQFNASVFNAANPGVNWQVNGIAGGDATHGTISTSGMYTAPTKVPNPANVTVTSVAQADLSQTASAQVTIMPSLISVVTNSLPSGEVGVAYNETLSVTGGTAPYNWTLINGALPANLSLNGTTGVISGLPKQ